MGQGSVKASKRGHFRAFARPASSNDDLHRPNSRAQGGLTIREYMATHLFQGLLANPSYQGEDLAEMAVECTDELLEALRTFP